MILSASAPLFAFRISPRRKVISASVLFSPFGLDDPIWALVLLFSICRFFPFSRAGWPGCSFPSRGLVLLRLLLLLHFPWCMARLPGSVPWSCFPPLGTRSTSLASWSGCPFPGVGLVLRCLMWRRRRRKQRTKPQAGKEPPHREAREAEKEYQEEENKTTAWMGKFGQSTKRSGEGEGGREEQNHSPDGNKWAIQHEKRGRRRSGGERPRPGKDHLGTKAKRTPKWKRTSAGRNKARRQTLRLRKLAKAEMAEKKTEEEEKQRGRGRRRQARPRLEKEQPRRTTRGEEKK